MVERAYTRLAAGVQVAEEHTRDGAGALGTGEPRQDDGRSACGEVGERERATVHEDDHRRRAGREHRVEKLGLETR